MNTSSAQNHRIPLIVIGALLVIWGLVGWFDAGNIAQGGWNEDGNNNIVRVIPGSPSDQAGLKAGDVVRSVGGISREDFAASARRGRPEIGETRDFVVERDGQILTIPVTFAEMVPQRKLIFHASFVVGICFLFFGLRSYLVKQNESTMALAITGILLSLAFFNGPYFENYTLRSITNALTGVFIFAGTASLLHFLMIYPSRSSFLEKPNARLMLFAPGLLAGLYLVYLNLATPATTSGLNTFTTVFLGIVVVFYLLGSVFMIFRRYSGASVEEKQAKGLNLMLVGTAVGLLPVGISALIGIFAPQVFLPGQQFYFLALILIPVTWSLAVAKGS